MIRIDENYVIDVDLNTYILKKDTHKTDKKTGAPIMSVIGYYPHLTSALYALADRRRKVMLSKGEYTLHEAIAACEAENQRLYDVLKVCADIEMPEEWKGAEVKDENSNSEE